MGDEEEDETTRSRFRLYRVRRTVLQILRDRGYMVASADLEMTEEQFREKFTDVPQREQLAILVQKRDDPTDQLFVFWPADPKVGVKPIKRYVERMGEDGTWAGNMELQAASLVCMTNICVHQAGQPRWEIVNFPTADRYYHVTYEGGDHYNSVELINTKWYRPESNPETDEYREASGPISLIKLSLIHI